MHLEDLIPEASDDATELFKQFILYDSDKRISAESGLVHRYFCTPPIAAKLEDMPAGSHYGKASKYGKSSHSFVTKINALSL